MTKIEKAEELVEKMNSLTVDELFDFIVKNEKRNAEKGYFNNDILKFNYCKNNMDNNKKRFKEDFESFVEWDIDRDGNLIKKPKKFITDLICLYHFGDFNNDEMMKILSNSKCLLFWRDVHDIEELICQMFGKIYKYHRDFHLEFWQGALANLKSGLTEEKVLSSVNRAENGKVYSETLLEIWKTLHPLAEKYNCQYTLMEYFAPAVI